MHLSYSASDDKELQKLLEMGNDAYREADGEACEQYLGKNGILKICDGNGPSNTAELFAKAYKMAMVGYLEPDNGYYINDWAPYYKKAMDYCINVLLPKIINSSTKERSKQSIRK